MPLGLASAGAAAGTAEATVHRTTIEKGAVRTAPKREQELFLLGVPVPQHGSKTTAARGFLRNRTENRTLNVTPRPILDCASFKFSHAAVGTA